MHLQEISVTAHQVPKQGKINSYHMVEDRLLHIRRVELTRCFPLNKKNQTKTTKKQTELSSQNFPFYYLKLEKAPWVTMIRCKSNTRVLLSFPIPGIKYAKCCQVMSGFYTARSSQTHKQKERQNPITQTGEQTGQASCLNYSYHVPHGCLWHETEVFDVKWHFRKKSSPFPPALLPL